MSEQMTKNQKEAFDNLAEAMGYDQWIGIAMYRNSEGKINSLAVLNEIPVECFFQLTYLVVDMLEKLRLGKLPPQPLPVAEDFIQKLQEQMFQQGKLPRIMTVDPSDNDSQELPENGHE